MTIATDERATAFNDGYDAYEVDGSNPHEPGTAEYRFWEQGREAAAFYDRELAPAPRLLDQLTAYEQQVARQEERIKELSAVIDVGRKLTAKQDATIAELREQVDSLKRERTAVRRELGEFYCPLSPDTAEGQDLENSGSFWLDQGVNLATLKISELTAELERARAWGRAWKRIAKAHRVHSWLRISDYARGTAARPDPLKTLAEFERELSRITAGGEVES